MRKVNVKCEVCEKEIYRNPNNLPKNITCSKECRKEIMKTGKYLKCDYCGECFYKKQSRISNNNFCSDECMRNYNKIELSEEEIISLHIQGKYDYEIAKLAKCSRSSITIILNKNGYENRHNKSDDLDLRNRISKTLKGTRIGINNHMFKGDRQWKDMARSLFSSISKMYMLNHNYTCEICGKHGGDLHVHHIKPLRIIVEEFLKQYDNINFDNFSELILKYNDFIDENNLVLTCKGCHNKIHYSDNHELSPYRWESATTIENTN